MEEQQLHRVQLHHAKAEGPLPSIVDTIRSIRESVLNKTTLEDVLKPAIRSVAFIFDDTRVADALAFLQDQKILSVRRSFLLLPPRLSQHGSSSVALPSSRTSFFFCGRRLHGKGSERETCHFF